MAEFRSIHIKIWQDEWFTEQEPEAKLLFFYLCTNRYVSICGMYRIPHKFIIFETGLKPARVTKILESFQNDGKAYYADGVMWVKNLRKYQTFDGKANENVMKRIQLDVDDTPDGDVKKAYLTYEKNKKTNPIPMANPLDTHAIPTADSIGGYPDKDKDTLIGSGAKKAAPVNPELSSLADLFSELTHLPKPDWPNLTAPQKKAAAVRWANPLRGFINLANGQAEDILREAIRRQRSERLDISAPQSIEKKFQAVYSERHSKQVSATPDL